MADFQFERKLDAKLILSILATGIMTFAGILEETALNITFPTLMEEFGIALSSVQWITTGYLLALMIMMPTSAFLKKKLKMKTIFILACSSFLAGTILCFAAPAFLWIVVGRVIQGLAAGVSVPLMFNIVLEQAPFEHIGFLMGFATTCNAMGPAFGPVYGGLVLQLSNWRMIFGFLIPIVAVTLIIGALSIRQSSELEDAAFDVPGFSFLTLTLTCLVFGLNLPNVFGWKSPIVLGLLAGIVVFAFLFVRRERHTKAPLINLRMFRFRIFTLGVICIYCCCTICPVCSFMLPNFLQLARGQNPLNAAMVLFSGCIMGALITMVGGHIYDKKGPKISLTIGAIAAFAGVLLLRFALPAWPTAILALSFVIYMFGHGMCVSNNMPYGLQSLPEQYKADGNAVISLTQNLGGTIGIVISSGIISSAQIHSVNMAEGTLAGVIIVSYLLLGLTILLIIIESRVLYPENKSLL